jgi:hypothetical protein
MGMMLGRDSDKSNGVNSGSADAELEETTATKYMGRAGQKIGTNLIRTKSCIMNLYTAFVGCVMYTFPFPSLKFV